MKTISEITKHYPNIEFSDKYLEVLKELEENPKAYVNVIGQAGVGKSVLLGIIHYAFEDENIVVCGTTGVSSALLNSNNPNIKASTIHSVFSLKAQTIFSSMPDFIKLETRELIENMDILIIDEISMCNASLFDYLMRLIYNVRRTCLKEMPKIVLFGDVLQLPPVINTKDIVIKNFFDDEYNGKYFYFNAKTFKKMNPKIIQLSKVYRQQGDSSFKDVLNRIRVNKATEDDLKLINSRVVDDCEFIADNESAIRLVTTNRDVELWNKVGLDLIDKPVKRLYSTFEGNFKSSVDYKAELYPDYIEVKEGCSVMILRNSPNKNFVNGDIGILEKITDEQAEVRLSNGNVVIVPRMETVSYEYGVKEDTNENNVKSKKVIAKEIGKYINIPIKVAYSITTWKAQGQTIDKCFIDFGNWITNSVVYVALSRFRNLNDFCLIKPLTLKDIKVNMEAIEWLNEHTEIEDEKANSDILEKLKENDKEKILKMIKDWEEKYNCKW